MGASFRNIGEIEALDSWAQGEIATIPAERRKPSERRAKGPRLLIPPATSGARDAHRRDHVVAVHVKPRAPLHQNIHRSAPSETAVTCRPEGASRG